MKSRMKWMSGLVLGIASIGLFAASAVAQTGMTVNAGFTNLPLRNCQGVWCGELKKLDYGQPLLVLVNDKENWAFVELVGTNERGWVCLENTSM